MGHGVILSGSWTRRIVAGLATISAVALTVKGTTGQRPAMFDLRGAIPQGLRPDESVVGVPWTGNPGRVVTVAELEAISAREPKNATGQVIERRREQAGDELRNGRRDNPASPRVAQWPFTETPAEAARDTGPMTAAFTSSFAFDGILSTESCCTPPDTNGAVGPNQIMIPANGRFKIFNKSGTLLSSFTDSSLWTASPAVTSAGVSDPHVRYDRTSGRWFITEIDVTLTSNQILVAVSSGSDISSASSFTRYAFAQDSPGGGGIDAGHFADYDTLGVDANALYVGVNEFTSGSASGAFTNTSAFVIRKSSVTGGGPIVVTAFRGLAVGVSGAGEYTPQGVQNDNPAATEGYFIGVDNVTTGQLDIRRISTPGATPTMSGTLPLTVPSTWYPMAQPAAGSTLPLDTLDDRLFAAELRKNRYTGAQTLWTAHNILVDSSGVGSPPPASGGTGDRNASRWYQIGNLTGTPTLVQSGTVFDGSASNPHGFFIPSIVMNGQGHAAFGSSYANATVDPPTTVYASRLSSDPAGSLPSLSLSGSASTYNLQTSPACGCTRQRWGDFSQTVVDPSDDMTIWTFQEYASATNVWTVRAIRLTPPGPAAPSLAIPASVPRTASINVTITATSTAGTGFFEPGAGFSNHMSVNISNGVGVSSITVVDSTHLTLNLNTLGATPGAVTIMVTNPDGQSVTVGGLLSVSGVQITGDFDGDLKSDMTLYKTDGTWAILRSNSGFTASTMVSWGGAGYVAVPGDYDGDGKIDPAVYNTATGQWSALKSSTSYSTIFSQSWGGAGYVPVPGDYDGDGKNDPALYAPATGQWLILKSSTGYASTINVSWGGPGYTPVPGRDFDGDGKADLALYQESTGTWSVLKSSTAYASAIIASWGGHGYTLVPGDYDGDGKTDLGLYDRSTGWWYILKSNAGYTTTLNKNWGGAGYDPVPADYDGDRRDDIAVVQRSTGNWSVLTSSTSYSSSFTVTGWGTSSDTLVSDAIRVRGSDLTRATDFDADGKADITIYSTAGQWLTLKSSTGYAGALITSWGGSGYTAAPGDFDGDGKVDLGLYQGSTGNWSVLLSSSGYTTALTNSAGGGAYVPVVADYDGDGKSDIAVYDTTTGNWFVLKSSTNYTTVLSVDWGGTGYTPAPGDYDGDGKADLGLYQQSTGNWTVLLSSTNYTTTLNKSAGGPGYLEAAGDYDGDGRTDFVVYNATTGLWFGFKSSTGYTTTISVSWGGGPGYQAVQGDYDGDGKVDLALYSTTGTWSILLSSTGYTTTLTKSWGGSGYTPVPRYP